MTQKGVMLQSARDTHVICNSCSGRGPNLILVAIPMEVGMTGFEKRFPGRGPASARLGCIAILCAVVLGTGLWSLPAAAQDYPARPITMIVPYPAGGPADAPGRVIADRMRTSLGQPVIIENVGGAGGSIGAGRVARARPDGYTIVLGNTSTHVMNAALYALPYDVVNDFAPISPLVTTPLVLFARKTLPAKDLGELIDWLKANPDTASAGFGSVAFQAVN